MARIGIIRIFINFAPHPKHIYHTVLKVSFHTLGCKLNYSETSTLAREFEQAGYARASRGEQAAICVVNSCSVTGEADKKCRTLVRRLVRENPGAIIAVTGCYAQLKPAELAAIEGVDLVVGNDSKGELFRQVAAISAKKGTAAVCGCEAGGLTRFFASFSTADRTRAFLKVQDGCDYHCSYCTVPLARGGSRNIAIADLTVQAAQIAATGCREIVITGINTGDFGRTTGESFLDLLKALEAVEGIDRYRISSIEPNLLTDEIIAFTARSSKFMPHFHIPLQSGCDRILGLMRRRYTTALFAERVEAVRRSMPDAFIGIDVIVGFPGETEGDFVQTHAFLENLAPSFLHVFPYSQRDNTPAAGFAEQIAYPASHDRVGRLTALSDRLHETFAARFSGTQADVLFESTLKGGMMSGFTANYIRVQTPYDRARINRICRVTLGAPAGGGVLNAAAE